MKEPIYYSMIIDEDNELERDKLAFEREKFIEIQKLEKIKAVLLFIPLIAAIMTIAYNIHSDNQEAKMNFELKSAEIVMDAKGPEETYYKAQALKTLFKGSLPDNFAEGFNSDDASLGTTDASGDKNEFLKLVIQDNKYSKDEIVKFWGVLYPADRVWLEDIAKKNISWSESRTTKIGSPLYGDYAEMDSEESTNPFLPPSN
jgi:hypothetical protein